MRHTESYLQQLVTLLLKLSVLAYLFAVIFPFISDPGFESTFGVWSVRWLLIIMLGAITLGIFVIDRSLFYLYGFLLVALASVYQLFNVLLRPQALVETLMHFYVFATAFYFLTRDIRHNSGYKKHRTRSRRSTSE